MEKKYLVKQAPHPWPFSHGVVISKPEKIIILPGQVAYDRHGPNRKLVGAVDIEAQTRQVFENIKTLLTQAGARMKDIVDLTVYLTDVSHLPVCGRVAQEYLADPPPAMTLIGVKALAFPELLIEIRAIAFTGLGA